MRVEITADTGPVLDALARLGAEAPRAITRALNKTIDSTKTAAVRALAEDTGLTQTRIRENVATAPATFDNQAALVTVSGRRIPIFDFGARQTSTGVSYRLRGGQGSVPHAFIATMQSGHIGVFRRKGPKRLPIVELYGPSLPHVFEKPAAVDAVVERATEAFGPNLEHEIGFLATQLGLQSDAS